MVCERVAILHRGTLRYCGSVDDLDEFVGQLVGSPVGQVVEMTVSGQPTSVLSQTLEGCVHEVVSHADQETMIRVESKNQADTDRVVDLLRDAGISLLGLRRVKVSLEDAFLRIVEKD